MVRIKIHTGNLSGVRSSSFYSASFTTFPILQQAGRQSTFHHWEIVLGLLMLCRASYIVQHVASSASRLRSFCPRFRVEIDCRYPSHSKLCLRCLVGAFRRRCGLTSPQKSKYIHLRSPIPQSRMAFGHWADHPGIWYYTLGQTVFLYKALIPRYPNVVQQIFSARMKHSLRLTGRRTSRAIPHPRRSLTKTWVHNACACLLTLVLLCD